MLYWQEAPARSTQPPLTSRTESSWLCASHRGPVINVSLAVHFLSSLWWWTGGGGEAVRKEKRIDLGPAPCTKGDYTAAAYWLFHSPSIITFDSHRFSRSAAIFHTSFTVQSQGAISLQRGMPLFSAAWFFSANILDNIRYPSSSARIYTA